MPKRIPTKTKVIRYKTQNPFMRTSEIAKRMGYTRSYVHKVLKENGVITKIPSGLKSRHVYCVECKEFIKSIKRKNRYNERKAKKTFCSDTCKKKNYYIELKCSYCKELFLKLKSKVIQAYRRNSTYIYCTIKCKNIDKRKGKDRVKSILRKLNDNNEDRIELANKLEKEMEKLYNGEV